MTVWSRRSRVSQRAGHLEERRSFFSVSQELPCSERYQSSVSPCYKDRKIESRQSYWLPGRQRQQRRAHSLSALLEREGSLSRPSSSEQKALLRSLAGEGFGRNSRYQAPSGNSQKPPRWQSEPSFRWSQRPGRAVGPGLSS